jgi:hypothetical protein
MKQLCARGENVSARFWDEWEWDRGGVARCCRSHTVPFHDGGKERSVLVSGGDDRVTVLHFLGVVESNGNRSGALLKRKCYVSGELLTERGAGEKKEKELCWWEAQETITRPGVMNLNRMNSGNQASLFQHSLHPETSLH